MTKFVLNSGGLKSKPERAKIYFEELFDGLGPNPRLLWCFFATLPDPTEERFEKYTNLFKDYYPDGTTPTNKNATIENFASEVANADAVYLHGGAVEPLLNILNQHDLQELFKDKKIGCNSASSMVFCEHYWGCDKRSSGNGLGLFPIKFLAHYKSDYGADDPCGPIDWDAAYKELEAYGDTTLPIHALEEGEFIVLEI